MSNIWPTQSDISASTQHTMTNKRAISHAIMTHCGIRLSHERLLSVFSCVAIIMAVADITLSVSGPIVDK